MSLPTPELEPQVIVAGTTVEFTIYDPVFIPDDGWAQSYVIANPAFQVTINSQDNGSGGHHFNLPASATQGWAPGKYKWRRLASDGSETYPRASGDLVVEASYSAAGDMRSTWEKILDDLEAAYQDFVSGNGMRTSFSVAGRSTTFSSSEEFIKAIHNAKVQVSLERKEKNRREGKRTGNSIQTRMS